MLYKPCSIVIDWFPLSVRTTAAREKNGRSLPYTSEIVAGDGSFPYHAYRLKQRDAAWFVEVAVNEKEVVVKITPMDSAARNQGIVFRTYYLPGIENHPENNGDIVVADCPGEKMFFHHYGTIINGPGTDGTKEQLALASDQPVYYYSGDERSAIYLDDLIRRKKLEYEKLTSSKPRSEK